MSSERAGIASVADARFGVSQGGIEVEAGGVAFFASEAVPDVPGRQGDAFLAQSQEDVVKEGVERISVRGGVRGWLRSGRASSGGSSGERRSEGRGRGWGRRLRAEGARSLLVRMSG